MFKYNINDNINKPAVIECSIFYQPLFLVLNLD